MKPIPVIPIPYQTRMNLAWEAVSLTRYLLYLVAISHTKSSQDVLKPQFWTKILRSDMELGIMCPAVGIPCQRCEFERFAPPLPDDLCEKLGIVTPFRSWTQSHNRHRRWVGLPVSGSTRLQRPSASVEKIAIVTPFILSLIHI